MSHIAHLGSSFKKQAYVINVLPLYKLLGLKKNISKVTTKISLPKYQFSLFNYPFEQTIPKSACLVVNYCYDLPLEKFEYQCMLVPG